MKSHFSRSVIAALLAGTCITSMITCSNAANTSTVPETQSKEDINSGNLLETHFTKNAADWPVDKTLDSVKDGILYIKSNNTSARAITKKITESKAFEFEIRMKVTQNGAEQGFKLEMDGTRIMTYVSTNSASVRTNSGSRQITGLKSDDFNTYTFNVNGNQAQLSVNGVYQFTYELQPWNNGTGISVFVTSSSTAHSNVEVDYIRYAHADTTISITSPSSGGYFVEGNKISLKSKVNASQSIPYVDYYANGTYIGTATAEEDYTLEWSKIVAGTYTISAKYGDYTAVDSTITVESKTGTLITQADKSEISVGEAVVLSLKRKPANVAKISYLINGTEFPSDENGELVYTSNILGKLYAVAKVYYTDGSYGFAVPTEILASAASADYIILQGSYIAEYTASEGAKISASDGTYTLEVTHSANGFTYLASDGVKTYSTGLGSYRLQSDGGVCDVYYNGQFAFSFIQPVTTNPSGITTTGVADLRLSGLNATLLTKEDDGEVTMLPDIGRDYAVEFTLDAPTDFTVNLNDGAYALDLTANSGSIVAMTDPDGTYENDTEIYNASEYVGSDKLATLCTIPGGRHAYRITVSNGICQLFIDNVWKASFRLPVAYSAGYIKVSGITPVVLRQTDDLYIFSDSFDNAGELDSELYYNVDSSLIAEYGNGMLTVSSNPAMANEQQAGLTAEFDETDARWNNTDILTFADGAMKLSTVATSAKTTSASVDHAKNYVIEARMRVTSHGAETGFKYEYKDNRILCYLRNGSVSITTDGEKFNTNVNTNEWHTYKFVVTNSSDCELFIDDVSKGTCKLQARSFASAAISAFAKSSDGTTPASMELDYVRFTSNDPVEEPQIRVTAPILVKAFAYTPTVSATVRVDEATEGNIYLAARYQNLYRNVLAGYNFETGTWEIVQTATKANVIASNKADFPFGQDVKLDLVVTDNSAALYVNGVREISTNQLSLNYYGNVGVCVGDVTAYVTDFSYTGTGRALAGTVTDINKITSPEVFEFEDGHIYVINDINNAVESTDDGYTWKAVKLGKYSNCTIKLKNGTIVYRTRENKGDGNYIDNTYISTDNGATFEGPFPIQNYLRNRITMNNKFTEGSDGRLYYASGESGDGVEGEGGIRVFYSDDSGRTWTGANMMGFDGVLITGNDEARMDAENTGVNCQESRVVEMPDGSLRLYVRTDNGFLYYSVSTDRGETWSAKMYPSEFISVLSAFNIERDPYTGNYYMAWEYNNKNDNATFQLPRTRTGLAVSYDNMETWEYVGDMHVTLATSGSTHMNIGIRPTKDAVYVTTVHYELLADGTTATMNYMVRVDKDYIKTTERFSRVHVLNPTAPSETVADTIATMFLVNDTSSDIYAGKKLYRVSNPVEGYIPASAAAAFIGSDFTSTQDTATLKIAKLEVVFTAGVATANVNGSAVALTAAPIASADGLLVPVSVLEDVFARKLTKLSNGAVASIYDPLGIVDIESLASFVPSTTSESGK